MNLDKVLASEAFVNSPQLCRFLRFLVDRSVTGDAGQLKEYVLGLQVFRRDESFDPRVDNIVRTEARRLRQKLAEYYQGEGRGDPVEIVLPKGGYRVAFQQRREAAAAPPTTVESKPGWKAATWIVGALVFGLTIAILFWIRFMPSSHIPSIAVLPLEDLSSDAEQNYFSDGMTDLLSTDLAEIHGLSVVSRTSAMQYKRTRKTVHDIARELKVDYLVEGTVTRAGDRVRVNAQLISASTDRHVWANSFERTGNDVLSLQAEIAQTIAEQVHIRITPQEKARLGARPVDLEAQDLYLKGRFNWNLRNSDRLQTAIGFFDQAIARDPGYALAYAGLGDAYAVLSYPTDRADYREQACRASRKAIELDPNLGEAYAGLESCVDQWNWEQREKQFRKALELSPGESTIHQWYGAMLIDMGRDREGFAELRRALELDPLAPSPNNALGYSFFYSRRYDRAIRQCEQTLQAFPDYLEPYYCLGFTYIAQAMYPRAIAVLEKVSARTGGAPQVASVLAYARARGGEPAMARRLIQEYTSRSDMSPVLLAVLYLAVHDKDHTFHWLDRAVERRSFASESIAVHPMLDELRSDARWNGLLRKMNLAR